LLLARPGARTEPAADLLLELAADLLLKDATAGPRQRDLDQVDARDPSAKQLAAAASSPPRASSARP